MFVAAEIERAITTPLQAVNSSSTGFLFLFEYAQRWAGIIDEVNQHHETPMRGNFTEITFMKQCSGMKTR